MLPLLLLLLLSCGGGGGGGGDDNGGNIIGSGNIGCTAAVCDKQKVSLEKVSGCGGVGGDVGGDDDAAFCFDAVVLSNERDVVAVAVFVDDFVDVTSGGGGLVDDDEE